MFCEIAADLSTHFGTTLNQSLVFRIQIRMFESVISHKTRGQ